MIDFTPGPWYAVEYAGYWSIQKEESYSEQDSLLDAERCDKATQNAKLAAAAPDMFEKLYKAEKLLDQKGYSMFAKDIRELLNRITGR